MMYKTIKWVLKKQIEYKRNYKWAWVENEFICVHEHIPEEATELYTAQQLLNKLNALELHK
jgi:hypothetical protein